MDKSGVAVVIVTYRVDDDLLRCLGSLERQTLAPAEVAVVVNGDVAGAPRVEAFRGKLPLEVVVNETNKGFAAPHGEVLSKLKSPWMAVLNADAFAEADWLEEMVAATSSCGDVGMVAATALMAHDPGRVESMGIEPSRGGLAYLAGWGEAYRDEAVREVFGPSGVAALYSREMLDEVGFFDPDFFVYYEDLDLAWKARWAGWRCVAAPRARVHHRGSAHLSLMDDRKTALLHRNKLLTIAQNWPAALILKNLHRILFWDIPALARSVVRDRSAAGLRARWDFLKMLPGAMKKRSRLAGRVPGAENRLVDDVSRARARGLLTFLTA